jgi:uncharacterized membrane protein YgcG
MIGLMAAAMTMFGGSGGSSGGGGASISIPSVAETNQENLDFENKMITDRLDRQIELLEQLNLQGSASKLKNISSGIQFEYDKDTARNTIRKVMEENLGNWQGKDQVSIFNSLLGNVGYSGDLIDYFMADSPVKVWEDYANKHNGGLGAWFSSYMDVSQRQFKEMQNDFQGSISEFISSVVDSVQTLQEEGEKLRDIYDELTDSSKYADERLTKALIRVDSLRGKYSFAEYIENQIANIELLKDELSDKNISLLLSQDIKDMRAQIELVNQISAKTGLVFENGAEDVLNYIEAIEMVSEAMVTSRNNIKSFIESFMDETQLLEEQSKKLGVGIVTNIEELLAQAVDMSKDSFGLTEEELNYLKASKSFLEKQVEEQKKLQTERIDAEKELLNTIKSNIGTLEGVFSSLKSTIDRLRDSADETNTYSLNKFYESMAKTQQLISSLNKNKEMLTQDEYKAIVKSIQDTTNYSGALSQTKNFTSGAEYRYAQLLAATQFEEMGITLDDELDYLKMIEENTRNTVDALTATLKSLQVSITDSMKENSSYFAKLAELTKGKGINSQSATSKLIQDIYTKYDLHKYQTDDSGYKHWENLVISGALPITQLETAIKNTAEQILSGSSGGGSSSSGGGSSSSGGGGGSTSTPSTADLVNSIYSKYDLHKYQTDDSGYKHWESQVSSGAIKVSDLESVIKATADKILGINSFAVGTPNVPKDMLAQIHQGEIITPKTYSEGIRNGDLMMGDTRRISNSMDNGMNELKNELIAIKEENKKMSLLLIKLTADNSKMLNLERAKA